MRQTIEPPPRAGNDATPCDAAALSAESSPAGTRETKGRRMSRFPWIAAGFLALAVGCRDTSESKPYSPAVPSSPPPPSSSMAKGRAIYADKCASCHGPSGHGDGPAADTQAMHPPDFSRGLFPSHERSGVQPTREGLIRALDASRHGKSMPAWRDLPDVDRRAVLDYLESLFPMSG
jgi:mono/diheme cytochrome c family protein